MPFTLAHPAAALPLIRLLGDRVPAAALVIGSMAPDIAYLLPGGLARLDGHRLPGLFAVSLPLGLALYVLFQSLLKPALIDLLPPLARRLRDSPSPASRWPAAPLGLLLGALTHVAWDAFTHGDGAGVLLIPALGRDLFAVGGYPVAAYKLLQHGGSLAGCALLAWRIRRWLARTPVVRPAPPRSWRLLAWGLLGGAPALAALRTGWPALSESSLAAARPLIGRAAVAGLAALAWGLLAYAICWRLALRRWRDSPL